jgi:hypothetical protein
LKYDFDLEDVSGTTNKAASEAADKRLKELNKGKGKKKFESLALILRKRKCQSHLSMMPSDQLPQKPKEVGAELYPGIQTRSS